LSSGYRRDYAITLLNHPPLRKAAPHQRVRKRLYTAEVQRVLTKLWKAGKGPCGKRLTPGLEDMLSAKVRKTYDTAKTPYRRILDQPEVPQWLKDRLTSQFVSLNPIALIAQMDCSQAASTRP